MEENELAGFLALKHANGMSFKDVVALHAHMLAEKIRDYGDGTPDTRRAADLIDPEVS